MGEDNKEENQQRSLFQDMPEGYRESLFEYAFETLEAPGLDPESVIEERMDPLPAMIIVYSLLDRWLGTIISPQWCGPTLLDSMHCAVNLCTLVRPSGFFYRMALCDPRVGITKDTIFVKRELADEIYMSGIASVEVYMKWHSICFESRETLQGLFGDKWVKSLMDDLTTTLRFLLPEEYEGSRYHESYPDSDEDDFDSDSDEDEDGLYSTCCDMSTC